ncbi:hypothetical protein PHLGIDRAFT_237460 [Phlebiopsis gigantea 11061_1 CR5-6]|uniref:Ricin B lectin domain-containing protein n=1 Tax=Phlebiopsis gigantea (strain 11061_1 CR5-6) TaxID=745531 RepID=A0A0C3NFH9_PHLG1|nr:hypothetical protein PHLGIDRAFT_237460 [Phlebiopsis gigantea 11061_1 CR5-6]
MTSLRDVHNPTASQQWSLTRIPFSLNPTVSSAARAPSSAAGLPRRRFVLQNVASGGFAAVRASNGNVPNIAMQSEFRSATSWHFEHTVHDDGRYDDMFALVSGSTPNGLCTLDFFGAQHIAANFGAYSPRNPYHMWKVVPAPTEGAFCFRHSATGRLLSQTSRKPLMDMAVSSTTSDTTCQWRIRDSVTGKSCPILYDSSLAIPPAEFAGPLQFTAQPDEIPDVLVLRHALATEATCTLVADCLKREHAMIRDMLSSGYSSLVLAPRLITGWKTGLGLYDVIIRDNELALGSVPTIRGKGNFDTCSPRDRE